MMVNTHADLFGAMEKCVLSPSEEAKAAAKKALPAAV